MSEDSDTLIRTWMASGESEQINQLVSGISDGRITLLGIVKGLGEYLTAEEDEARVKGVDLLSQVLQDCPPEKINAQATRVLTKFLCGKLDDPQTVVPALKGLLPLVSLPTFSSGDVVDTLHRISKDVKMKALEQSARQIVYTIIDTFMSRHRDALKKMGDDFVSSYSLLADGEKDPRNLLLTFAISRVISIEFDISNQIEAMFNIIFCYFPISFRPPPNSTISITADDLRTALRLCMSANPLYGPMAIPLFLEKLAAGSPATKVDTLQTVAVCLPVYGKGIVSDSAKKIWNSLKLEVFQPTNPEAEQEALTTSQVLIKTLYGSDDAGEEVKKREDDIQGLAREACQECITILGEPEKSQARPATKVLCALIDTTDSVSRYVCSQTIPHFIALFRDPAESSVRAATIMLLGEIIKAARDSWGKRESTASNPLSAFKEDVLAVLISSLKVSDCRLSAIAGLKASATVPSLFTDSEIGYIVISTNELLQDETLEDEEIRDASLELLKTIAAESPQHIVDQTLPTLLGSLPDKPLGYGEIVERQKIWRVLDALSKLCVQHELFEILVVRLSTKLDLVFSDIYATDEDAQLAAAYSHSILTTLHTILSDKVKRGDRDVPKYFDRLVRRMFYLFVHSVASHDGKFTAGTNPRVMEQGAKITSIITQTLSVSQQQSAVDALFPAFLNGEWSNIADRPQNIPADVNIRPFSPGASIAVKSLVAFLSSVFVTLDQKVQITTISIADFLSLLLTWYTSEVSNSIQQSAVCHLISTALNKWPDACEYFLSRVLEDFWRDKIASQAAPSDDRKKSIELWVWITKSLVIRNHPSGIQFSERLFHLFDDTSISWDAARAVGDVVRSDSTLTKNNHAVIKVLYAQKYFNRIIAQIKDGFSSHGKPPYLVALASLITAIPTSIYSSELSSFIRLLLRGLELPDADIRADIIQVFISVADGGEAIHRIVSEHAITLVSAMLLNSRYRDMPQPYVRILALRYLALLPSIVKYDVLHPQRALVLGELGQIVDDPKRDVRREAVDTRITWYQYSAK